MNADKRRSEGSLLELYFRVRVYLRESAAKYLPQFSV